MENEKHAMQTTRGVFGGTDNNSKNCILIIFTHSKQKIKDEEEIFDKFHSSLHFWIDYTKQ